MSNIQIILAVIGSEALWGFLKFLITRKDRKEDKLVKIEEKLDRLERDSCRTQILMLMSDYPSNIEEIMKISEHYFKDLSGDWYLTSLFKKWLSAKHLGKPDWFDPKK